MDDLKAVVEFLRQDGNISLNGLWGRSMGAVTSLIYGAEDPSIVGMILDCHFSDLVDLMMELVGTYKFTFTVKFAIQLMRRAIQKKANFDIMDLNTIKDPLLRKILEGRSGYNCRKCNPWPRSGSCSC